MAFGEPGQTDEDSGGHEEARDIVAAGAAFSLLSSSLATDGDHVSTYVSWEYLRED